MIIVNLKGGLGNQMFQYAAGKRLAEYSGENLLLDLSFLQNRSQDKNITPRKYELSMFNIEERFASLKEVAALKNIKNKIISKAFPFSRSNPYILEKHFNFDPNILQLRGSRYLDGHWMSEKFFQDIETMIRLGFQFKNRVLKEGDMLSMLVSNTNSVAIQVRRGDYVTNLKARKIHGVTSIEYFNDAIKLIRSKMENPVFFVFTDDSEWCIKNFKNIESVYFIEKTLEGSNASLSDYFQLLTCCKHFIISNSTFAWWGAWLGAHDSKIVVAPTNWFADSSFVTSDIYPPSWIRI